MLIECRLCAWHCVAGGRGLRESWVRHRIPEHRDLVSSPHDNRQGCPRHAPCWRYNQQGWGAERKRCRITSERNWYFFQETWYLSWTLENEKGLADEKQERHGRQNACSVTEQRLAHYDPWATSGHQMYGLVSFRMIFTLLNDRKNQKKKYISWHVKFIWNSHFCFHK